MTATTDRPTRSTGPAPVGHGRPRWRRARAGVRLAGLADVEGRTRTEVVGPLVRLLLDVRAVTLFVTALAVLDGWEAVGVVALMAATSVGPLLVWSRIGPFVMRHPAAVALDVVVLTAVFVAVGPSTVFGVYALTTATLAGILYGRAGGLILTAPVAVTALAAAAPQAATWGQALLVPVLLPGAALLGAELRRLLDERVDAQRAARANLVRAATAEERARLARELHDSLAKTMRGISLAATCLDQLVGDDPVRARAEAARIAESAAAAADQTRLVLDGMRADDLDISFADAVAAEADQIRRGGTAVATHVDPDLEPDPDARWELLQIVSEALTNAERHARAASVAVIVRRVGDRVELHVVDDGAGMAPRNDDELVADGHYGLAGIGERARRLGGSVALDTAPGAGLAVSVTVPAHIIAARTTTSP